ncbi:hypothetical protein BGS_0740 [Beggiatoa sp. SS]|nr:hypothetical protein BGS_0740 [Beggiatoa sp. SS]
MLKGNYQRIRRNQRDDFYQPLRSVAGLLHQRLHLVQPWHGGLYPILVLLSAALAEVAHCVPGDSRCCIMAGANHRVVLSTAMPIGAELPISYTSEENYALTSMIRVCEFSST